MQENVLLKNFTTLRLGGQARYFFVCMNEQDIVSAVAFAKSKSLPIFALGGGSNVIILDELHEMVCLKLENKGIEILTEDSESVSVRVAAGEVWDDLVEFVVERGVSGIEALSAIPGTCGASPIQNIGAYGAEVSQVIENVRIYNFEKQNFQILLNADCHFGYRDSIFKHEFKGKCIIESVVFRLSKNPPQIPQYPKVGETLASVQSEFPEKSLLAQIRATIERIRADKLPDPVVVANVGSFFKNIFVDEDTCNKLLKQYPDLLYFASDNTYKIPAGWLIEKTGFKGYTENGVGVYDKNALVLVNTSTNSTENLLSLARLIQSNVKEKFDVELQIEPEIIT